MFWKRSNFILDKDRLLIPCLSGRKEENFIDNLREVDPGEPLTQIIELFLTNNIRSIIPIFKTSTPSKRNHSRCAT